MKLNFNCITCNVNQAIKMMSQSKLDREQKEELMREVLSYLSGADYSKCNPEVILGTWRIITKHIGNDDPYKDIKAYYNEEVLKMSKEVRELIEGSGDKFNAALKISIAGNLIDFTAKHKFDLNMLREKVADVERTSLAVDNSKELYNCLQSAKSLLYLGDNSGEICLDKLFIEFIKKEFPNIKVCFGVRGSVIVNDVTLSDADMVRMQEVCEVISNGDGSLGTVIERTSDEFKEKYYNADVVIAKGQGNYESLSETDKSNVFHLFMAKCDLVAKCLGVKPMSIVCVKNSIGNGFNFEI